MADTNLTPFGRHRLVKRLAAGGMGELFLALGPDDAPCVVKRMLAQHLDKPDFIRMFLAEARLLQRLRHQNIVDVHEVGEVDGQPFFVMELVRGRSLRDLIDELGASGKALPARHVVEIGLQLLHALEHAHRATDETGREMGIVHRDINPHNVLIGWDGVVKLIDFGIAKSDVSGFHTAVGTIKGKFAYMSPEQSAADPLDARSDLFSAAIVLYEALTLDNPFSRPNVVLALEAIQLHPVSPPSSTRSDATAMDDVLMRCLEKNPDLRFASAAAFADALALCVDRLPESPGPLSALMRVIFATDIRAETRQFERLGIEAPVDDQPTDPGQPAPGPTTDAPPKVAAGSLSPPLPTEPGLTGRTLPDADPCHPAPLPAAVSDHEPLARRVPTIIRRGAERADRASEHASSSGVRGPEADAFVSSSAAARGRMPEASAPALGSGLGTSGSGPESGSRLPSVKRRPWIGYGVLLAITTVGSFGITRAVMQPRAAAVAPSPVGTLRIEAEPELWVRIAGSAWLRTPIEAQLLEPTGALELRTEGGVTRRATFRVQGRRLDLRVRGRGISVGTPKTQTGLRTFTIEGPGEVTGSFHWTPPSSEKSRSRG